MKANWLRTVLLCLIAGGAAVSVADHAWAQGVTTGSISGRVVDAGGQPLADVVVTATEAASGIARQVLTDAQGRYVIPLLRPGTYDVVASLPPRPEAEQLAVAVSTGERAVVNLQLQPVAVQAISVSVAGRPAAVNQAGVVDLVLEEQVANLPTAGRDFTDFINLSPLVSPQPEVGTGGQFSIGGARTSDTNVQVDGADANNAFFGENRGSSRVPFTFSLESVKEFQVIANGYDVEFGRFGGGVVNAVTKRGGNEWQSGGFFFWRDEALTKDNFDGSSVPDFQSFQFGALASGPIVRDKVHFFASGDFQLRKQPTFALDPERSGFIGTEIDAFRNVLESVYGFDTDPDIGIFDERDDQANVFGRVDWAVSNDHNISARFNYSNFSNENDRISPNGRSARTVGGTFKDKHFSLVGEWNALFGRNVFNTLRVQYSDEKRPRPANNYLPSVTVPLELADGGRRDATYGGAFFGILFDNNLEESKVQVTDNLTFNAGRHAIKVGTDNVFTSTLNVFWLNGNGFFDFRDLEGFQNRSPSFFLRFVPETEGGAAPTSPTAEFDTQEYAFFAQDAWQLNDELLLTFGLRWDYTNFQEGPALNNSEFNSIVENEFGVSTTTTPNDKNNWGPRAAFTWDVGGDQVNLLRGGAGLFYGRVPTVLHSNILAKTPNALLTVICFSSNMPEFNYEDWTDRDLIPRNCEGGSGPSGQPEVTVWDSDFQFARTWKANLGYERRLSDRWKVGVQAIYSRASTHFHVQDINLRPEVFRSGEGRPVHVDQEDYDPTSNASQFDRAINSDLARLWRNVSTADARAWNLRLDFSGQPVDDLLFQGSYGYNNAKDNQSFSCCLEIEGWRSSPTSGNPNDLGEVGDDLVGAWGPSNFERRHVFVLNAVWQGPADFLVSGIWRSQSGNPWTPIVDGDLNADGEDENDRAFLPDPDNPLGVQFETTEDLTNYRNILARENCLQDHIGRIVPRNSCNNPWFHRFDLRLQKGFRVAGTQRLDLVLDAFNVLDLLGWEAGAFTFKRSTLFRAEGYDEATNEVIYSTVSNFGEEIPSGFEPFQFQLQLGVRYSFNTF